MKKLALTIIISLLIIASLTGCKKKSEWNSGNFGNTKLNLDMESIHKAFQTAQGPEDFEKKVNEIYTGDEVISIFVDSAQNDRQKVSLYIDNAPQNGKMDEGEQLVTLSRTGLDNQGVTYSTQGYGPYAYYSRPPTHYPLMGALATYWVMRSVFYPRPYYYTPIRRFSTIRRSRASYRRTGAYRRQVSRTRSTSRRFNKDSKSRQYKSSSSRWGGKKRAGSWSKGSRRAKSASRASTSRRTGNRSSKSWWGGSRSRGSSSRSWGSSRRSRGGRRRR